MALIRAVCFDIGGVLAEVGVNWSDAIQAAGLKSPPQATLPFEQLSAFSLFQAGQLDIEAYLDELSDFLGVDAQTALRVHEHILLRPTAGTLEIISELHAKNVITGCLSNTNALHWPVLNNPVRFPNVAALQFKGASQLIGFNKPAAESYQAFQTMAGVEADEIVFFEDGPGNIAGATLAGWNAVLIDPSGGQECQIREALIAYGVF